MTDLPAPQKWQMLGRMAGHVAHDFNNLLAIIEGYAHMLERQLDDRPVLQEKIHALLLATERGVTLTRKLVEFGRDTKNGPGEVDLAALVRENRVLLKPVLSSRIELRMHIPQTPLQVAADSDRLTELMIAFALSARQRKAGQVIMTLTQAGDRAILFLQDDAVTTIADDADFLAELERLKQGWRNEQGRLHSFCQPHHGSEVTLVLPLAMKNPLQDKTILVVDDEEDLLTVLEDQLQGLGLKVLKAANADTALLLQKNHDRIDFLLTDVVMPGTDGVTLAEILSSQSPHMGVVYMTGRPESREFLSPVGDDALVVAKPLRPEALSEALRRALEKIDGI